jgi:hypothetical protein
MGGIRRSTSTAIRTLRRPGRFEGWRTVHVAAALIVAISALLAITTHVAAAYPIYGPGNPSYAAYYGNPSSQSTWPAFCSGAGDGASYTGVQALGVPACGPTPTNELVGVDIGANGSGGPTPDFQCVEYAERYLYVTEGWSPINSTNGDQVVAHYASAHSLPIVANGTGELPRVGAVMSFADNSSFNSPDGGHVAVVTAVTSSSVTVVGENQNGSGPYTDGSASMKVTGNDYINDFAPSQPSIEWFNPPSTGPPPNGTFVSYQGNVYRIAGGAPLYINSWTPFGGPQPTEPLSAAQWATLRQFPLDGTTVSTADTGGIFKIAGGAPLWLNSCQAGCGSPIEVEQYSINSNGTYPGGTPHLLAYPADGTTLSTADTGGVFKIAGGAPLWLNSCAPGCGSPIEVMQYTINSDGTDPWGPDNLNAVPVDGTTIASVDTGGVFKIAGGAPLYLNSCVAGCGNPVVVDQTTINSDAMDPWGRNSLNSVPSNREFLQAAENGGLYRVAGGAPIYVSDCTALGFPNCDMAYVTINAYTINSDGNDPWGPANLSTSPASETILQGEPSGHLWEWTLGCIGATSNSTGAVQVNDAALAGYVVCPSVNTPTLPTIKVGSSYSATLTVSGGTAPYTWSVLSGNLPTGLRLSSSGVISGTPTAAGAFGVVIQLTDSSPSPLSATISIAFNIPLTISPASLPRAKLHKAYAGTLKASGGTGPYTWSLISGALPTGLTLSASGTITGKASAAGTYTFVVDVSDASSPALTGTKTYKITVP